MRLAFTSNPPLPPRDLLSKIFLGKPYAELQPAERQQIDGKVRVYFPDEPAARTGK